MVVAPHQTVEWVGLCRKEESERLSSIADCEKRAEEGSSWTNVNILSNLGCSARGKTVQSNPGIHARKGQRFCCRQYARSFAVTKGAPFYRLSKLVETVTFVVTLLAHGCPLQAIVAAFGFDAGTVVAWPSYVGSPQPNHAWTSAPDSSRPRAGTGERYPRQETRRCSVDSLGDGGQ
jgi:transposase-like protein